MSSITDKPILNLKDDLLDIENYSIALSKFINKSDTPITIGLQGEWGTGKTSLMSLLLENFIEGDIACSWVNTWEYSLFKDAHETTPGVLKGMLEKLKDSCKERGIWTLKDESNEKFKKASRFLGGIANQVISNQTGINIKDAASSNTSLDATQTEIAEIKKLISGLIQELINDTKNPVKKVVFFIDDLDRIPPNEAVEVLESLKNIFDIPNCIFILAIDYDVVVKGLESKFGPKTKENEREFRSFFDKIIQVPFSMPTGTYNIENFLVEKLKGLGITIPEDSRDLYSKTVKLTIGFNPRSLKRYLNSYSLINHLKDVTDDAEDSDDFMLFALLGIQISYPQIFRLLTMNSDFINWKKGFSYKLGFDWEVIQEKIKQYGDNELLDEEWEQVAWGACQDDPYLKAKAFQLLELLNLLRDKYGEDLENTLENTIAFASITNVDDNIEVKEAVKKVGNKTLYNNLDSKIIQLQETNKYDTQTIENWKSTMKPLDQLVMSNNNLRINFAKSQCSFSNDAIVGRGKQLMMYIQNPSKKLQSSKLDISSNMGDLELMKQNILNKINTDSCDSIYIKTEKNNNQYLSVEANIYSIYNVTHKDIMEILLKTANFIN